MKAGFFSRIGSYIIDLTIIIFIVYLTFNLFSSKMLQSKYENFSETYENYQEIIREYNEDQDILKSSYENEEMTKDEYDIKFSERKDQFDKDIDVYDPIITDYFINAVTYFIVAIILLNIVYTFSLKGQTIGRKLFKLKMVGNVNYSTLFTRDILLKYFPLVFVYYIPIVAFYLFFMQIMIDLAMISVSRQRMSLRDKVTRTQIIKTGYGYPEL